MIPGMYLKEGEDAKSGRQRRKSAEESERAGHKSSSTRSLGGTTTEERRAILTAAAEAMTKAEAEMTEIDDGDKYVLDAVQKFVVSAVSPMHNAF